MTRLTEEQFGDVLLDAVEEIFLSNGSDVSLGTIAQELGLQEKVLRDKFGTRESLMIEALSRGFAPDWLKSLEAGPDERPFPVQFDEVVENLSVFLNEIIPKSAFLAAAGVAMTNIVRNYNEVPALACVRRLTCWFELCFERALIREVDFQSTALAIVGALQFDAFLKGRLPQAKNSLPERQRYAAELVATFNTRLKILPDSNK